MKGGMGMNQLRNVVSRLELMRLDFWARREQGQTLVEYSLILVLIALVVIGVVTALGGTITSVFSNVASSI